MKIVTPSGTPARIEKLPSGDLALILGHDEIVTIEHNGRRTTVMYDGLKPGQFRRVIIVDETGGKPV